MVKTQLPQPGCGQEVEEENFGKSAALRWDFTRAAAQLHLCGDLGSPISSQLSKEETINLQMLLVFPSPAGSSSEQLLKSPENRRKRSRQRLGRGFLLSPEMLLSWSDRSLSCSVPGSHPGGFFWSHPVFILHLRWFLGIAVSKRFGVSSSSGAGTQGGHEFLSQTAFS